MPECPLQLLGYNLLGQWLSEGCPVPTYTTIIDHCQSNVIYNGIFMADTLLQETPRFTVNCFNKPNDV